MNKGKHGLLSHVENKKQKTFSMTSYFQDIWKVKTLTNIIPYSYLFNKWSSNI